MCSARAPNCELERTVRCSLQDGSEDALVVEQDVVEGDEPVPHAEGAGSWPVWMNVDDEEVLRDHSDAVPIRKADLHDPALNLRGRRRLSRGTPNALPSLGRHAGESGLTACARRYLARGGAESGRICAQGATVPGAGRIRDRKLWQARASSESTRS